MVEFGVFVTIIIAIGGALYGQINHRVNRIETKLDKLLEKNGIYKEVKKR